MKRKRGIVAACIAATVILIGILGWYFGIKIPKEKAYEAYVVAVDETNTAVEEYNESINAYNMKAKEVIKANDEFETAIGDAQSLIDSGDEPYEGEKITTLSNTVKDSRNNKISTPSLKEVVPQVSIDEAMAAKGKSDIENASRELEAQAEQYSSDSAYVRSEEESLVVPDYSEYLARIAEQTKELQDSYAIQKQITAPEEDWVITRLGRVKDVASIAPVTEENDPNGHLNKDGGYTATVYFMSPLLGTENLTGADAIDMGTNGGGAIEVYRNTEDAENRNSYLGALDGGIFSSGSHRVLGTMVVRTSDDLMASQQETLTNAIVAAMTELD